MLERKFKDNVPLEIKKSRLQKVIDLQKEHSLKNNESSRLKNSEDGSRI